MEKFMAAAIQMDSGSSPKENMRQAESLIQEAAGRGARLIAMPETVSYIGGDCTGHGERIPGGPSFQIFSGLARKHHIWLHCGSIYEQNENAADSRPYNTSMVIDPDGGLAAKYRKLHPFDVRLPDGTGIRESDKNCPGNGIVVLDTGEVGMIGLSVCYDVRFCELYRLMALKGAQVFTVPANFTANTGKDHWEVLLRARAIENGCYVIAPAQTGRKLEYQSYGRSMIVDPWGNVIAKVSDGSGIALAQIDLDYVREVQEQIPVLKNRRTDVYRLEGL